MLVLIFFSLQLIGFNHDRLSKGNSISISTHSKQQQHNRSIKRDLSNKSGKIENVTEKLDIQEINLIKSPIQVKILYESNNNNQNTLVNAHNIPNAQASNNKCDINENCTSANQKLTKGQTLLTSYFRPIGLIGGCIDSNAKDNDLNDDDWNDSDNALQIDYAPTNELTINAGKSDKKCLLLHRKRIRRKYSRISTLRQRSIKLLLFIQKQFTKNWRRFHNKNVLFVYQCIISFHRFAYEFMQHCEQNETILKQSELKMTTEAITINRRVQKLLGDNTNAKETNDDGGTTTTVTNHNSDGGAKRPPKSQRSSDNSRLLLLSENAHESSEKEFGM